MAIKTETGFSGLLWSALFMTTVADGEAYRVALSVIHDGVVFATMHSEPLSDLKGALGKWQ